ncbi:hypothetical protein SLEP1_g45940 [Rubroshorea leprosula]|uniref:Uncharacterized protein n=1 Tax=Rubroshorea leprosula TaxID=152421 RepID=A0AAV5LLB9_9ROSI|nr:hypothetical protein SLEP1_g45940 [Rubroshorea leprosula]
MEAEELEKVAQKRETEEPAPGFHRIQACWVRRNPRLGSIKEPRRWVPKNLRLGSKEPKRAGSKEPTPGFHRAQHLGSKEPSACWVQWNPRLGSIKEPRRRVPKNLRLGSLEPKHAGFKGTHAWVPSNPALGFQGLLVDPFQLRVASVVPAMSTDPSTSGFLPILTSTDGVGTPPSSSLSEFFDVFCLPCNADGKFVVKDASRHVERDLVIPFIPIEVPLVSSSKGGKVALPLGSAKVFCDLDKVSWVTSSCDVDEIREIYKKNLIDL